MKTQHFQKYVGYIGLVILLFTSFACSTMPARTELGEPKSEIFYSTKNLLDQAVSARADEFAPNQYKMAVKQYFTAEGQFEKGKDKAKIEDHLQEAQKWARKSIETSQAMQNNFPELIVSRDKAIGVNAPKMDLDAYEKGNKLFLNVASEVGDGKIEKARNKAQEATRNFKSAELQAIQQNMVGALNKHIEEAENEGAKKWAPETFKAAEKYRDAALDSLAEDRYNDQLAQAKVDQGNYYTRKAMFLTKKIKESEGDRTNWEKLFLQREEDLNKIASSLGVSPEFDKGFQEPVSEIDQSINELKSREQAFNRALTHKDQALTQAEQQIRQAEQARAQAEQQIRQAEETRQRITAEMQRTMQQRQAASSETLKRVQALFSPNDAQVKLDPDNNVTIVLRSLNFDTSKSLLKPEHYQLVANVKQAMDMFPNQKVIIAGHTDFTGSSEFNKQLSLQRANSVMQYLKSLGVDNNRMKAFGAGEADPIAPNNTPEGRRLNRRIEVTILSH